MKNKLEEIAKILIEEEKEATPSPNSGLLDKINSIDEKISKLERILGTNDLPAKNDEPQLSALEDLKKGIENLRK